MEEEIRIDVLPWSDDSKTVVDASCHHKLTLVNKENRTAVCSICGPCKVRLKQGKAVCWTKVKEYNNKREARVWADRREAKRLWKLENALPSGNDYRRFAKPTCERCGFESVDQCQIDVHHIDRNRKNGHISNLVSLCANCHRLEHKDEKFSQPGRPKKPAREIKGRKSLTLHRLDFSEEKTFSSRLEAAKFLAVDKSDIYSMIKGKRKSIKGWVLSFIA